MSSKSPSTCAEDSGDVPVEGGIILLTEVITMLNRMMNFWLYSGPIWRPPISDRHLRVTFRNSGTSRNCTKGVDASVWGSSLSSDANDVLGRSGDR